MTESAAQDVLSIDAAAGHWVLDAQASTVAITHRTMWGLVAVKGAFASLTGTADVSPDGSVNGEIHIDASSIDTKNKKRDEHLRSPDFFDVATHPHIIVDIRSATLVRDELHLESGLTVKGVREPTPLTAHVSAATSDTVSLVVDTTVDRGRFAMSWNKMGMIKGLTSVTVNATFKRSV